MASSSETSVNMAAATAPNKPTNDMPAAEQKQPAEPVLPAGTTARRLRWRIDLRLLPFVTVMYVFAFLDRINIGNARAFGLAADLNLTGDRYNTALTIFFVPYVLCEIPANLLMKRLDPRHWLPFCMLCFGIATIGAGLVQNYAGLLACRFLLGLFESSMFAGSFYLLGMWYTRYEAAMRFCFFFQSTSLAGAFGGLLASAIGKMDGMRGYHGWRWIFILEGTLTAVVALAFFFFFPPFPEEAKWLTEDERRYIQAHLAADQGSSQRHSPVTLRDFVVLLTDVKVWLGWLAYFSLVITAYAFAFFAPTIIQTYGYGPIETQLRSVPPWVCTLGLSLTLAYVSDRLRHRFAFAAGPILLSIAGFAILLVRGLYGAAGGAGGLHARYSALFLIAMGTYSAMPIVVCWFQMNLGGHKRRSMGSAFQIGAGNAGGFVATYTFLQADAPLYRKGFAICISFQVVAVLASCAYGLCVLWENRRKRLADREYSEEEKEGLGDLSPTFKYMF